MSKNIQEYPHRAKEYGYVYPDNPYITESMLYSKLSVFIFCNPKFVYVDNPTGLTVELVDGKLTKNQKKTIDLFLEQQNKIKFQLTSPLIAFYNHCLEVIADSYDLNDLAKLGATSLTENDIAGLEERIYLEDVHLISSDTCGDFGMEFAWNLDDEHTITTRFKAWTLIEVNFTSDINW